MSIKVNHTKRIAIIGVVIISILIFIGCSIHINYTSGYFDWSEVDSYLSHFLGDLPFLKKIFDFRVTEIGAYRGRELATVFNYFDAQFILLSFKIGFPHFLSLTHYLGLVTIALSHLFFTHKYLSRRMFWISFFLVLLFLSSPAPFFTGYYYRTSKILTAVTIFLEGWLLFIITRRVMIAGDEKKIKRLFLLGIGSAFITFSSVLSDEGGLAFSLLFALYPIIHFFIYRQRLMLAAALGFLSGIMCGVIYRYVIGIFIIDKIMGIRTQLYDTSHASIRNGENFVRSFHLLLHYIGLFAGNLNGMMMGGIILVVCVVLFFIARKKSGQSLRVFPVPPFFVDIITFLFSPLSIVTLGFFFVLVILHVMTVNHPHMFRADVRLIYYTIPFAMVFFLALTFLLNKLIILKPQWEGYCAFLIIVIVGLNIFALRTHYATLHSPQSLQTQFFDKAPEMIRAIQPPNETFLVNYGKLSVSTLRKRLHFSQ